MCGLGGYIHKTLDHTSSIDPLHLEAMQQALAHRGPNGYALWMSQEHGIGLMHRRLSIVDLSDAGTQPMMDPQKTTVVMCNGEIYNHATLKQELTARGHQYRSHSDTETILHAYKEWGIAALQRLRGMFVIVIYDLVQRTLYVVRDRMGIKPLYFSLHNNMLSFASEIKALFCLPWVTRTLFQPGLHHYLTHLATPAPMTLYHGIYKLPAGHYLQLDAQKNLTFHEWYNPLQPDTKYTLQHHETEQQYIARLDALLDDALHEHTMADVPYGVFLSGGIDSSVEVAYLRKHVEKLKTFNIAFADGPEYQETQWARHIAQQYQTEHYELFITEKESFDFFQKMIYHQDEPLADSVCIPLFYLASYARDHGVTVIQTGEGSDELFCGYPDYLSFLRAYTYLKPTQKYIPAFAKKALYYGAQACSPHPHRQRFTLLHQWAHNQHLFLGSAIALSDAVKQTIVTYSVQPQSDPVIDALCPGLLEQIDSNAFNTYHLKTLYKHQPDADFLTSMAYLELKHRLPELLLMRMDKMTMAASIEARVPYLDHRIVEYALQLPASLKCRNGTTKYILKKVAEKFFSPAFIYRKKMGFPTPTMRWLSKGAYFKPYFLSLLHDTNNPWHNYLNIPAIKQLLAHHEQYQDCAAPLWTLQNLMATPG